MAISENELLLISEMRDNRITLEKLARSHGSDYAQEISHQYVQLEKDINKVMVTSVSQYIPEQKKLNPYVMGGIAQSIAGPAAGLYTALKTDQENAEADAINAQRFKMNSTITMDRISAESNLRQCIHSLDHLLYRYKDMQRVRKNWYTKQYSSAKEQLIKWENNPPQTREELDTVSSLIHTFQLFSIYPDAEDFKKRSQQCYDKAENQIKQEANKKELAWGLPLAVFLLLTVFGFLFSSIMAILGLVGLIVMGFVSVFIRIDNQDE